VCLRYKTRTAGSTGLFQIMMLLPIEPSILNHFWLSWHLARQLDQSLIRANVKNFPPKSDDYLKPQQLCWKLSHAASIFKLKIAMSLYTKVKFILVLSLLLFSKAFSNGVKHKKIIRFTVFGHFHSKQKFYLILWLCCLLLVLFFICHIIAI
jgi:hypothetical protein